MWVFWSPYFKFTRSTRMWWASFTCPCWCAGTIPHHFQYDNAVEFPVLLQITLPFLFEALCLLLHYLKFDPFELCSVHFSLLFLIFQVHFQYWLYPSWVALSLFFSEDWTHVQIWWAYSLFHFPGHWRNTQASLEPKVTPSKHHMLCFPHGHLLICNFSLGADSCSVHWLLWHKVTEQQKVLRKSTFSSASLKYCAEVADAV